MKLTEYITEEFIDMCDKSTEIQDLWKSDKHNAGERLFYSFVCKRDSGFVKFVNPKHGSTQYVLNFLANELRIFPPPQIFKELIWLPTQADFQELMQRHYENEIGDRVDDFSLINHFNNRIQRTICTFLPDSLEKFWLVYFMTFVYGKKWGKRKKDWVPLSSKDKKAFRLDNC